MFRFVVLSHLVAAALGAIGPIANVHVANKVIQPDGFSRSYVSTAHRATPSANVSRSAVLAGANPSTLTFPGPVIRGLKVRPPDRLPFRI
jgi:iron transport multicopper oxidase